MVSATAPAFADDGEPADPGCDGCRERPKNRSAGGTHFIAEAEGGASLFGSGGPAVGALLGFGGKLPGYPPRLYVFAEAMYANGTDAASLDSGVLTRRQDDLFDLGVGLRVYLPVWGPVRIFADAGFGRTHVSVLTESNGTLERSEGWVSLFQVGFGPQVRVLDELSVGARMRFAFNEPLEPTGPERPQTRTEHSLLVATLTAHF